MTTIKDRNREVITEEGKTMDRLKQKEKHKKERKKKQELMQKQEVTDAIKKIKLEKA